MPEFIPISPVRNFLAGRQNRLERDSQQQSNALAQMNIERGQRVNALRADPNATPEQFIRAGDPYTANALASQAQATTQQKQAAIQQIGGLAKQAILSGKAREFVGSALTNPAYASVFKSAGVDPSQIDVNSPTFEQDL